MRILLTIEGLGDRILDIGPKVEVSSLIESLGGPNGHGLLVERTQSVARPNDRLEQVDLRYGDRVRLVDNQTGTDAATNHSAVQPLRRPAAILRLLTGPEAPASIELGFGEFTIGRSADCDVMILDESLSRRHAALIVDDDSIELMDLGSRNGVAIDNVKTLGRRSLTNDTMALLGETWISVEHLSRSRELGDVGGATIPFNRPPRVVKPYEPTKTKVPAPPEDPPKQRVPKMSAAAPLLMGAGMIYMPVLAGGKPNFMFGLFMLFSPLMLLASFFENRSATRIAHREALETFHTKVSELETTLDQLHNDEQQGRRAAAPAPSELQTIVETLSPRLWERALDDSDVLSTRIGTASLPSQNELDIAEGGPRELRENIDSMPQRFAVVDDVPMLTNLGQHLGVGISGPSEFSLALGYSVLAQLATLHSPAELLLAAMVPENAQPHWEWMKWLPHCPVEDSAIGGYPLAADELACRSLLTRLLQVVDSRLESRTGLSPGQAIVSPAIVVLVAEGLPVEQNELTRLLEVGPQVGVFTIWLSAASRRVPRSLGAVVQIEADGRTAAVGLTGTGQTVENVAIETLSQTEVEALARSLSPVEDIGAHFSTASQIPSRVNLVDLLGGPAILDDSELILEHWKHRPKTLEAPVGRLADRVFTLDIRRDGPHGLVGGTTGAGKSEFLQSWVMGLAATHNPQTVTFLLVDYKGGAAFKDCSKLPHTVGMVTDLDNAGVRRSLVSLRAELHHRERLFAEHDCSDLLEMIDKKIPEAPPSLLIIVDEFAALVQEVPEFVDGMVDVAQRGRSLGLHLVLATQRPAGVITPQVKANTDLRIALRMADAEDSMDVIDVKDSAEIDRKIPGRGIARISRDRYTFQSAYVGGVTKVEDDVPSIEIATLEFGSFTPIQKPETTEAVVETEMPPTDLERLVENICNIYSETKLPLPRKPWLEPLAPIYDLADLNHSDGDSPIVLGIADRPEEQAQSALPFDPDADGGIGIIGTGGSGKTVALRTLAAAASHKTAPENVAWVYGIDFGGRGLRVLESLPHVGTIAYDDDIELIRRMLSDLEATLDQRIELLSSVRAASLEEFRTARPDDPINRIYLLVDNYPSFHEVFEPLENERYIRIIRRLILEGRQVGVHVALTSPRRDAISFAIQRAIGRWLILRQTSTDEYRSLEAPVDILSDEAPAGRAIHDNNVAQLAILGGNAGTEEQADALMALGERLTSAGVQPAPAVRLLPTTLHRSELGDQTTIGIRDRDFAEYELPDGFRVFMVSGPRASGRSTVLSSLTMSVAERFDEVYLLSMKRPSMPTDDDWNVLVGQEQIDERISQLLAESDARRLIAIDDAYSMVELGMPIDQLIDLADGNKLAAIVTMEDNRARSGYDPFVRSVTAHKLGLLLRPSPLEDNEVFGLAMPRIKSHLWPPGRGYLIDGQTMDAVQVASP